MDLFDCKAFWITCLIITFIFRCLAFSYNHAFTTATKPAKTLSLETNKSRIPQNQTPELPPLVSFTGSVRLYQHSYMRSLHNVFDWVYRRSWDTLFNFQYFPTSSWCFIHCTQRHLERLNQTILLECIHTRGRTEACVHIYRKHGSGAMVERGKERFSLWCLISV